MKTAIKSLIIIAIIVSLSILSIVCIYYFREENSLAGYRSQILPSGRSIKVTSFHLAWGVEHDNRISNNDCFNLEYVSSVTGTDTQARDREALEVFELIENPTLVRIVILFLNMLLVFYLFRLSRHRTSKE